MDYKEFDCLDAEIKLRNEDEPGTFSGMGAVFGNKDFVGDVIERGAFANSLRGFERNGRLPPLLWSHDMSMPIGRFLSMEENTNGLKVKGRINLDTTKGADAHALMKAGDVNGLSIGFRVPENGFTVDEKRNTRRLKEIELLEVSVVALPANDKARTQHVKEYSPEMVRTKRDLENALRDAGFSKSLAAYIVAGWQPPVLRDAGAESLKELLNSIRSNVFG